MKLSIAMTTYNGAAFLSGQLESFVKQSRLPDELIVCDDGSTDETVNILRAFQNHAPFEVHIYQNECNLGVVKNFAKALSFCQGDVIFLSDQDDFWLAEKVEIVETYFTENREVLLTVNDCWLSKNALFQQDFTLYGQIKSLGLPDKVYTHGCCMSLRRELLDMVLPIPDFEKGHDVWFGFIAQALTGFQIINQPLQYYRRHGGNVSQWFGARPEPLVKKDFIEACANENPLACCEKRLARLDVCEQRISAKGVDALRAFGLESRVPLALRHLAQQKKAVECRLRILRRSRLRRIVPSLLMFFRGQYGYFSGWKSLVKDLLMGSN
ncbi:MAG: glycosyltransferase [Desulfuromonadales bacterium]|nr:glycosyltransferase [Desulfuromonadales bacterium]